MSRPSPRRTRRDEETEAGNDESLKLSSGRAAHFDRRVWFGLTWFSSIQFGFAFFCLMTRKTSTLFLRSFFLSVDLLLKQQVGLAVAVLDRQEAAACPFQEPCHHVLSAQHLSLCLALHCERLGRVHAYAFVQTVRGT